MSDALNLETRQASAQTRLEALKRERAEATLKGEDFDSSEILALESQSDAFAQAKQLETELERQEARSRARDATERAREALQGDVDDYGNALREIDKIADALVEGINRALRAHKSALGHAFAIDEKHGIMIEPDNAISQRLAKSLSRIDGHSARMRWVTWGSGGSFVGDDWAEREHQKLARQAERLFGKENENAE